MMAANHQSIATKLREAVASHIRKEGCDILASHERATQLSLAWLGYLRSAQTNGTADELLNGFHAAILEAAGCLAIGLVRPAVFSMRTQFDILFAWIYFKDHPVEWRHVELTGEKYHLVSEVRKYLGTFDRRFQKRFSLLRRQRTRGEEDPYRLLSAHVHSQNSATLPPLVGIEKLVQPKDRCLECVALQEEISEYLSDVLTSCFVTQWADLPESVTESIRNRLGAKKLEKLCMS